MSHEKNVFTVWPLVDKRVLYLKCTLSLFFISNLHWLKCNLFHNDESLIGNSKVTINIYFCWTDCVHFKFSVMYNEVVNLKYLKFANCVICFSLSLSLYFFSPPKSVFPLHWHGTNHSTGLQSFSASMNVTCDWIKTKKIILSSETSPDQSHGSAIHSTISNGSALCLCIFLHIFVCVFLPSLSSKLPLYFFFLVCGKQMKNLGRKAVSACLLKRTIFARGKCCSNCAAEHALKRVDGTYSLGIKGVQGGGGWGMWGHSGHPYFWKPPAHSFTVT